MLSAIDVAEYILQSSGHALDAMTLQKLVYYCQGWSLGYGRGPLFCEHIEAWASGPVIPDLYQCHRGEYYVQTVGGNPSAITQNPGVAGLINAVVTFYAGKTGQQLSDLTHVEDPWRDARIGISSGERSNMPIENDALARYFGSLVTASQKASV